MDYKYSMIQLNIKEEIKKAMLARDTIRLNTLRGLSASFTNELVAKGHKPQDELGDEDCLAVIRRLVKQRKESIEQFKAGNRQDLVDNETAELAILEVFLPQMMSIEEVRKIVEAKKIELGITDKTKLGMFVGTLMKDLKGKADGADVKAVAESLFE